METNHEVVTSRNISNTLTTHVRNKKCNIQHAKTGYTYEQFMRKLFLTYSERITSPKTTPRKVSREAEHEGFGSHVEKPHSQPQEDNVDSLK